VHFRKSVIFSIGHDTATSSHFVTPNQGDLTSSLPNFGGRFTGKWHDPVGCLNVEWDDVITFDFYLFLSSKTAEAVEKSWQSRLDSGSSRETQPGPYRASRYVVCYRCQKSCLCKTKNAFRRCFPAVLKGRMPGCDLSPCKRFAPTRRQRWITGLSHGCIKSLVEQCYTSLNWAMLVKISRLFGHSRSRMPRNNPGFVS
jgi:hypothetical protein